MNLTRTLLILSIIAVSLQVDCPVGCAKCVAGSCSKCFNGPIGQTKDGPVCGLAGVDVSSLNCAIFDFGGACDTCGPSFTGRNNLVHTVDPDQTFCVPTLISKCGWSRYLDKTGQKQNCHACLGGIPSLDFMRCEDFTTETQLANCKYGQRLPDSSIEWVKSLGSPKPNCAYCEKDYTSVDGTCVKSDTLPDYEGCIWYNGTLKKCLSCDWLTLGYYMKEEGKCTKKPAEIKDEVIILEM